MMNILAIGLLVSTLTAAGVLSPPANPSRYSHQQTGLLHEKNRIIVLEYEREVPASNGEIGVQNEALPESMKDKVCDAFGVCRDKLSGAASEVERSVKNVKDELSDVFHHRGLDVEENVNVAKDTVSDAKDTVKDNLSQAKEKTKGKLSETVESAENKLSRAKETAEDKLSRAKEKTEDKLSQTKEMAEDKLYQAKEAITGKLSDSKEKTKDSLSQAKQKTEDKLSNVKENAENMYEASKDKLSDVYEEVKDNLHHVKEQMEDAKEKTKDVADKTAKNLTDIMKGARDVAYDMASYMANPNLGRTIWSVAQLVGFAMAYGTSIWVTFVSSHVLGSALPRQQFGIVQSRVYPVYFRTVAYGVGIAFLAQFFGRDRAKMVEKLQGFNLLGALGLVLVNLFFLEPMATKVMFERLKAEKEEGRGHDTSDMTTTRPAITTTTATTTTTDPATGSFNTAKTTTETELADETKNKMVVLNKRLRKWNGYSSSLNVMVLMALTWHLVHLARCCD